MSDGGRDRIVGFERRVRLLAALEAAGPAGVDQQRLADIGDYRGAADDRRSALTGEISDLNRAGWTIENVAAGGEKARYALRARETRLWFELTRRQQAELDRVALLARRRDAADPARRPATDVRLDRCVHAVAVRAVLDFHYRGAARTVHPRAVRPGPSGWYVIGIEEGRRGDRYFAVDNLSHITVGSPGTATVDDGVRDVGFDPASWLVDPPEEVTVETSAEFAGHVIRALGPLMRRSDRADRVLLTFPVTHQAAFRMRLYPLGTRVRVVGPDHVRAMILADLARLAAA